MKRTLIQLRAEHNLTQEQLARLAGVGPRIIYKMEKGRAVARENAEKVLAVLGVRAEEVEGLAYSKPLAERVNRSFTKGSYSSSSRTEWYY